MELAVEDFSGGEVVEELILSWFEIIELVITFFCCKKLCISEKGDDRTTLQRHSPVQSNVSDPVLIQIQSGLNWLPEKEKKNKFMYEEAERPF
jgi:hypothetical protein